MFAPTNTHTVEIGDPTTGSQFDRTVLTGQITLGGTLAVQLLDGYSPGAGATFEIIDATGARNGTFNAVDLSGAPLGATLAWDVQYSAAAVTLTVVDVRPNVVSFIVGDGNPNRSGVATLALQFDQAVTVSSATALRVLLGH